MEAFDLQPRHRIDWQFWPEPSGQQHCSADDLLNPETISRPDIEDDALIAWGLIQSKAALGLDVKVDVLHGEGTNLTWEHGVSDEELERIMQPPYKHTRERSIRMCFINTLGANAGWLPGNFEIRPRTIHILLKAGLSKTLLTNIYSKEGRWAKMANQRLSNYDENGNLVSFEICYQHRSGWGRGVSFTHFVRTPKHSVYFCINFPARAFTRLESVVKSKPRLALRDFFIDALVADDGLKEWQTQIDYRRGTLLSYEKLYDDDGFNFKLATTQLHRLARHWIILGQDITDFQSQLNSLHQSYVTYKDTLSHQSGRGDIDKSVDMCESFGMLISQCDTCIRWTNTYLSRTHLRIDLLFHLANQRESRTNTQIATLTADVARQTQRDSASMITIAAVTMLFLPGTFVSAILSTTFFNYGDDGLHVSAKWWVLPAATIPLTVFVFGVWLGWRYVRLRRERTETASEVSSKGAEKLA